ncbi:MAG: apolipoprotein N-acyltransferase [Verrucomicrobiota bacterium]
MSIFNNRSLWNKVLALLTGLAMALPFLGLNPAWVRHLGWIPFFAMTPLAWVLFYRPLTASPWARARAAFFLGWIAGVVFFGTTLFWISSVAWEGVALLPPFLALYFGCWSLFVVMVVRPLFFSDEEGKNNSSWRSLGAILLSAAGWVGLEWLRGTLFTGFGWNSFGVSFYQHIFLIQFVDITGVPGLSFLGVMTGCMTAVAMERHRRRKKIEPLTRSPLRLHGDVALVLFLVIAALIYGAGELSAPLPPQEWLSVAAVQGNIPQNKKYDFAFEEEIMNVYEKETRLALQAHPDLVVWPEAATPRPLLNDEKIFSQVSRLVQDGHADLLTGSDFHDEKNPSCYYNAAILLSSFNKVPQVYAKIHLVPFGEYIPFRKTFPLFEWIIGDRVPGDFNTGPGPKVLQLSTKAIGIAPLICFEDTLGDLVRRFALQRAQLLITLTNDGWFGHTVASRQHAMNALFRAAETKLPLLRVANTGVTCVIDRHGRMTQVLRDADGKTFLEGVLFSEVSVPLDPATTFYTRHGDWFSYACLGVMMVGILWNLACPKKKF